jgi:acyl carrier protein
MMEIKEFIANFANQFEDTDISLFTEETEFRELDEWSSLIALSVMAMIAEEYNVILSANEMEQSRKVEDLYNIIKSKI